MKKKITIDENTFASNPGNTVLNPFVWFKYNFEVVSILTIGVLISVFLSVKVSLWFIIILLPIVRFNVFYWLRQRDHFLSGDSNGGLVISVNPTLVAVTTDLTKGFGEYPVIKIIRYRAFKKVAIGDRIPTVALYMASKHNLPHWVDFFPIPLEYATNNKTALQNALNSYDETQWQSIEQRLLEVPQPFQEGLYKVEQEYTDWKTTTIVDHSDYQDFEIKF